MFAPFLRAEYIKYIAHARITCVEALVCAIHSTLYISYIPALSIASDTLYIISALKLEYMKIYIIYYIIYIYYIYAIYICTIYNAYTYIIPFTHAGQRSIGRREIFDGLARETLEIIPNDKYRETIRGSGQLCFFCFLTPRFRPRFKFSNWRRYFGEIHRSDLLRGT